MTTRKKKPKEPEVLDVVRTLKGALGSVEYDRLAAQREPKTTNNLQPVCAAVQIDFSKSWVEECPEYFGKHILEAVDRYPSSEWSWKITSANGFITVRVERNNTHRQSG